MLAGTQATGGARVLALNLWTGWVGILAGMLSGAAIGLFFHDERWLGGYASWPRRLLRLGHVSFSGIAFLNIAFAATLHVTGEIPGARTASWLLVAGAVAMPAVCSLAAWWKPLRHLFVVPVASLVGAALALLLGGVAA
jgi:hypothetical protein